MRAQDKESRCEGNEFPNGKTARQTARSDFGSDAAGPYQTPAGHRLKNSKQTGAHQGQTQPESKIHRDNTGDQAQSADHPTRHTPAVIQIRLKKTLHTFQQAGHMPNPGSAEPTLASHDSLRHNETIVNWFNENFLLASFFWGTIACGYLIYGWKQKALMPFLGGLTMTAASILIGSAVLMSLACVALMVVVYWLARQGY
jgi:hypothetical protein